MRSYLLLLALQQLLQYPAALVFGR